MPQIAKAPLRVPPEGPLRARVGHSPPFAVLCLHPARGVDKPPHVGWASGLCGRGGRASSRRGCSRSILGRELIGGEGNTHGYAHKSVLEMPFRDLITPHEAVAGDPPCEPRGRCAAALEGGSWDNELKAEEHGRPAETAPGSTIETVHPAGDIQVAPETIPEIAGPPGRPGRPILQAIQLSLSHPLSSRNRHYFGVRHGQMREDARLPHAITAPDGGIAKPAQARPRPSSRSANPWRSSSGGPHLLVPHERSDCGAPRGSGERKVRGCCQVPLGLVNPASRAHLRRWPTGHITECGSSSGAQFLFAHASHPLRARATLGLRATRRNKRPFPCGFPGVMLSEWQSSPLALLGVRTGRGAGPAHQRRRGAALLAWGEPTVSASLQGRASGPEQRRQGIDGHCVAPQRRVSVKRASPGFSPFSLDTHLELTLASRAASGKGFSRALLRQKRRFSPRSAASRESGMPLPGRCVQGGIRGVSPAVVSGRRTRIRIRSIRGLSWLGCVGIWEGAASQPPPNLPHWLESPVCSTDRVGGGRWPNSGWSRSFRPRPCPERTADRPGRGAHQESRSRRSNGLKARPTRSCGLPSHIDGPSSLVRFCGPCSDHTSSA
jgi:hypothetical protein